MPAILKPMEARLVRELPRGPVWRYEPKWDGFRCLIFRNGAEVRLQSKSGQALGRYFPEVVDAVRELKPRRFLLDGELLIADGRDFSFDKLLLRIHPAASRVTALSQAHPARVMAFDLLHDPEKGSLLESPLRERRRRLEAFAKKFFRGSDFQLSPQVSDIPTARRWLESRMSGRDGVVAKRSDLPYLAGEREGMQKVKWIRSADCVVGGFRRSSKGSGVGSLLLGLYDDAGLLDHVGFTSSFDAKLREQLPAKLKPLIRPPGFTGKAPGGPSRWSRGKSEEWLPLAPRLVVEVAYDHFSGGRFRHGTKFLRWRPDKRPGDCTFDQVWRGRQKLS